MPTTDEDEMRAGGLHLLEQAAQMLADGHEDRRVDDGGHGEHQAGRFGYERLHILAERNRSRILFAGRSGFA